MNLPTIATTTDIAAPAPTLAEVWAYGMGYMDEDGTLYAYNGDGMPVWDCILFDQTRERHDVRYDGKPACLHEFADGSGILRHGERMEFYRG